MTLSYLKNSGWYFQLTAHVKPEIGNFIVVGERVCRIIDANTLEFTDGDSHKSALHQVSFDPTFYVQVLKCELWRQREGLKFKSSVGTLEKHEHEFFDVHTHMTVDADKLKYGKLNKELDRFVGKRIKITIEEVEFS